MDFLDFSSYDMDTWTSFIQDKWYVLVIALIVILLIVKIVKTVVKWFLIVVIVLGLIFYSGYTLDDVKSFGSSVVSEGLAELKEIGEKVSDNVKDQAVKAMVSEAKEAKYVANGDGTYTVTTSSITLTGKIGEDQVSVSVKGAPAFKVQVNDVIKSFIQDAQENG